MPKKYHLTEEEEKARYDLHENDPSDERYREFLGRLFKPLRKKLSPHSKGLDFGSGPGPTLSVMLEEEGHQMNIFDIYYANNPSVFEQTYDFITTTETAEHLSKAGIEFNRLWNCIRAGGYLGVMTKRLPKDIKFSDWHYMKDDTHVTFYTDQTFRWMAEQWNAAIDFPRSDVAIFQKSIE